MMKMLVMLAVVGVVAAAPQVSRQDNQDVQLLRYDSDNIGDGSYAYAFEQSDGNKRQESGELRNAGTDEEFVAVKGSYSWVGPDGVTYIVNYIADENGFQPTIEQGPGGGVPSSVVASLLG